MYKKLLGQTAIYGFGTIIIRLFPFIISPFLTRAFGPTALAPFVDFYSVAGIMIVLLSHGMETTFFRFAEKEDDHQKLITTSTFSVVAASLIFMLLGFTFRNSIAEAFKTPDQVNFLTMMVCILGIDGLSTMPFVILRKTGRPKKFALIKILNGLINFVLLLFFIVFLPQLGDKGLLGFVYNENFGVGYVFVANLIASTATFLLLFKELKEVKLRKFSFPLWKKMMAYSLPITIAGLAGIINETLDRQFLKYLLPEEKSTEQMAIYGTVCRLVTFMTLFRQAYLMGIEPFFFSHSRKENSRQAYSKLMTFFVVANCLMLLGLCANLEWISHEYIRNPAYYSGIPIVPLVLIASVFLGIYLNLSIWYKLTDKTIFGAYISIIGAVITIGINYFFIPEYGYWASAWATFFSYFIMMVISYGLGHYYYPIPYNMKKLFLYLGLSILFSYLSYYTLKGNLIFGNGLFLIFLGLVLFLERNTIKNFRKS
ncbi:oligosaccharide flippase family protein [Elizabethkingia argentiflava]|uniref:Oligosaccharide flippase family protein n=1 Tax=Elizabethkingia argenteiflava TaxID=2681556 RepID=A0A845PZK2_9FLAO|nr:oligosaccharide flippase family protein [Elizabethkingia argenteiflava]NAW51510.1 oligosaccharide flippase family protein [Elizabethkingia argenteiflava]